MIPNYESPTGYASLTIIGILPRMHMYVYTWHTSWKLRSIEEPPAVKPETRAFANVRESAADHFRSLHVKKILFVTILFAKQIDQSQLKVWSYVLKCWTTIGRYAYGLTVTIKHFLHAMAFTERDFVPAIFFTVLSKLFLK